MLIFLSEDKESGGGGGINYLAKGIRNLATGRIKRMEKGVGGMNYERYTSSLRAASLGSKPNSSLKHFVKYAGLPKPTM